MPNRQIFLDVDLKSQNKIVVRHYHGTTTDSRRNPLPHWQVKRSLERLNLKFDRESKAIFTIESSSKVETTYKDASHLVDRNGDLLVAPPKDRRCMGVLHWRAMSLACTECPVAGNCYKIIRYRLMFGGMTQFRYAIANNESMKRAHDVRARGRSQGYELEVFEPTIRDLKVLYYAYWRDTDRTVGYRLAGKARKLKKAKTVPEKTSALSEDELEQVMSDYYGDAVNDGKLEKARKRFASFRETYKSDHLFRQLNPARLAIVKVCWDAVKESHKAQKIKTPPHPAHRRRGDIEKIHACSEDLLGIIETFHPELMETFGPREINYHQTYRHVQMIEGVFARERSERVRTPE